MFDNLTEKISAVFDRLRGKGVLTEDNIAEALREIRIALLEADVALATVKVLTERIRARAIGTEVIRSVTPGQMVIKIVHDELLDFLGLEPSSLNLQANSPFSFLMVGLQGSGKTTTAAKIANLLKEQKRVLLVSLDIYRPAAQLQLEQLAQSIGVQSLPIIANQAPVEIVQRALAEARRKSIDLIVFDTAGRTNIDKAMMEELKELHAAISPLETLLVADGMLGQDAVQIAKSFQEAVPLTGLVFTRMDGSARGGAVLSMKHVTACPVKLLGTGERVDRIIPFDPQRIVDQILDRGDIVALVERAAQTMDPSATEKIEKRIKKGRFDLTDMQAQLENLQKMGGLSSMLQMLPGAKRIISTIDAKQTGALDDGDKAIGRQIALIRSMTPQERKDPSILNGSRRRRIASGAGSTVQELNRFLKQFDQMRALTRSMTKKKRGGLAALLNKMPQP